MMKTILTSLLSLTFCFSAYSQENDLLKILEQSEAAKVKTKSVEEHLKLKELRSIIGSDTGDTNIFLQKLFSSDYQGALFSFNEAVEGTPFQASNSAIALHAFLLWQNGLRLHGLEKLVAINDLQSIAPLILDFWRPLVQSTSIEWRVVKNKVNNSWGAFFGLPSQIDQVKMWSEATQFAAQDQVDKSAKLLSSLLKEPDPYVEKDLVHLTASRLLYQKGYLDASLRYLAMISKSSDWWYVAQEEAAWAHMRKGEVGAALAITQSLMHDKLQRDIGPETVFLHSLLNLKVCNYTQVIQSLKSFKERFRPRVIELSKVAQSETTTHAAIETVLTLAEKEDLKPTRIGANSRILPREVALDRQLKQDGLLYGVLKNEAQVAGRLYSISLEKNTKVGFSAEFEGLKQKLGQKQESLRSLFFSRVKDLARSEISEIQHLLQKMHIVEAEVIQQTGLSERIAKENQTKVKSAVKLSKVTSDQVTFKGDQEIWFDELSHYKLTVSQGCRGAKQ